MGYREWGSQSWTVFCRPATVAVGGCERKDKRKPMGGSQNDDVNVAAGTRRPAVAIEIACHRITSQSFAQRRICKMTFVYGLSNRKILVFIVKKLLNVGVDLTLWRRVQKDATQAE